MSENKHTPGPWIVAGESIITQDDTHCIAVIEDDGGYQAPAEQREANANLIAASPELFRALKHVIDQYDRASDFTQFMDGLDWKMIRDAHEKGQP